MQLVPIYQTRHKLKKNTKISKQIIDDKAVDKCKAVFDTTDWSLFISDDISLTTETITDYINFTLTSNSSCEEFIINPNQRPWITSELKAKIKEKYDIRKCGDQTLRKEKQAEVNKLMSDAKLAYKNKMLAHMSSNMKRAWQGIKKMSGLQKPTSNNYNLMSKHEQTTLANELNTFYTRFNGSVADPGGGDDGVVDVMADGDSDGGVQIGDGADGDITGDGGSADGNDRDNTAGGDGNSESTDDGQFTPITVEEVSKLFLRVRLAKILSATFSSRPSPRKSACVISSARSMAS